MSTILRRSASSFKDREMAAMFLLASSSKSKRLELPTIRDGSTVLVLTINKRRTFATTLQVSMQHFLSTRVIAGMMLMSLMPMRASCLRAAAPFVGSRLLAAISPSGGSNRSFTSKTAGQFAARSALEEVSKGEFKRKDAAWRNWISQEPDSTFPPEKDRYHLFVAYACPWAHRTLMTRAIKGLEDVISVTVVHPIWQKTRPDEDDHAGWIFGNPNGDSLTNVAGKGGPFPAAFPDNEPNPFFDSSSIREVYEEAGDTEGKYSVPVLWDKKQNTIVSNESSEIIRMLNKEFNAFARNPDFDLDPSHFQEAMKEVDDWIYPTINNGVYRCGFATSQEAYDEAITELTESFDRLEEILERQRFVAGDTFTLSDIRLFVTLLRFDEVYVVYFKTNTRRVMDSPAMLNYCRDIYQMPGVKDTVDMEQIKTHYFCSHPVLNTYSIIPRGTGFEQLLEEPHNRDSL